MQASLVLYLLCVLSLTVYTLRLCERFVGEDTKFIIFI